MTLKQLVTRVNQANEVLKVANPNQQIKIRIDIDGSYCYSKEFDSYKDIVAYLKKEYIKPMVEAITSYDGFQIGDGKYNVSFLAWAFDKELTTSTIEITLFIE